MFLCGDPAEAESLCIRNLDALDGSETHDSAFYQQYRDRLIIVTPSGKRAAFGAAVTLHALCKCRVEILINGADLNVEDLLALPRAPMFTEAGTANDDAAPMKVYNAAELAQRPAVEREWIVDQWLPARCNAVIGGHGGSGKSMLMAMLAVCVAAGVSFYGLAVERGPVLIYACEDDPDEWKFRMTCAAAYLHVDFESLLISVVDALNSDRDPALFAAPATDTRAEAMLTPVGAWLAAQVKAIRPRLVIVDAATDAFGGDEIRRREVRRFLRAMRLELAAGGACVVHVLHVDKTAARGATTTDLYSGSTDWNNGVRARLAFYRPRPLGREDEGEDEADELPLRLELQKANYAKRGKFIDLRYEEQAHVFVQVGGSETTADRGLVESIERLSAEDAIVAFVATAQASGDPVHAGQKSNRNLHARMKAAEALPRRYAGRTGAKQLFAAVERLRAQDRIGARTERDSWRNKHEILTVNVNANAQGPSDDPKKRTQGAS